MSGPVEKINFAVNCKNKEQDMDIERIKINEIIAYDKNAKKHPKQQIEQIKESIMQFGMNDPIAIDENNVIIEGHGRLLALKDLGYKTVDCIRLTRLDEGQKRAYILVHNKLTMNSDFDINMLNDELSEIYDVDMEQFGFDLDFDIDVTSDDDNDAHHRETTMRHYNLDLVDIDRCVGKYQMPVIQATDYIPKDLIAFNYMLSSNNKNCGIHCFVDDYQFERLWNTPKKYIKKIREYDCFFSPDFSLYMDMPFSMKAWNVFRSRLIGQYYQDFGIEVIPTISWAERTTFDFAFDGIEPGGTVAISTIGVKRYEEAYNAWVEGMDEMIKRIQPKTILCYGGQIEYDYKGTDVIYYNNKVTDRMHMISEKNSKL